ncbi:MAG: ROK family protein [Acidobacteria bacterium]|nr:MAG: ROK family protein [Acidobacteriota bacterium]
MRHVSSQKERDKAAIMAVVRRFGPLSRVDVHGLTQFRPSGISLLVRELLEEGKLQEAGPSNNPLGRKQTLLRINEGLGFVVGVEWDVSTLMAASLDLRPQIIAAVSEPTNLSEGADGLIRQLLSCARQAIERASSAGQTPLGIAVADPGLVDTEKGVTITSSQMEFWRNIPLQQIFEEEFKVPFLLESNTRAMTIAERMLGAGEKTDDMVYIDYRTGVGAGVITGGSILRGSNESAGEFGHTHVVENGPACKCGSFGCLEAMTSAAALANKARKGVLEGGTSEVLTIAGRPEFITGAHVLEAARRGDRMCSSLVEDMGNHLGLGIANLVNLFNPSVVVFGGLLELAGERLLEQMSRIVKRQALPHNTKNLQFRFGKLGPQAGVLGAGMLVLEKLFEIPALKPPKFLVSTPENRRSPIGL